MIQFIHQHLFVSSLLWLVGALLSGSYFKVRLLRWTYPAWLFIWWFIVLMVFGEEIMCLPVDAWRYINRKK